MAQNTFRIERSTTISAPAETIFPFIDDFHAWSRWSPYEKLDPIIQAAAPSKVVIALTFTKPMKAQNTAEFSLEPSGGGTRVT